MVKIYRRLLPEEGKDRELWIGWPSWDPNGNEEKMSVKFVYPRSDGRPSRAAPEVPINILAKMLIFVLETVPGQLSSQEIAELRRAIFL